MSDRAWQAPDAAGAPPAVPPVAPPVGPPGAQPPGPPPGWAAPPPGPPPGWASAPPGPPPGWAPPPKPGLIPLRPLSFGTLLWAPFRTLRRNPAATFGSGLVVQLASLLVSAAVMVPFFVFVLSRTTQATFENQDEILTGGIAAFLLAMLVPTLVGMVLGAFLQGVMVVEVATGTLGERLRFGALWRRAATRIWPLLGWTAMLGLGAALLVVLGIGAVLFGLAVGGPVGALVAGLLVFVGALGVGALWVWIGTKVALVPSVIVLERRGIRDAVRRSWQLTDGAFWRTFGTLALVTVILTFAAQVVTQPFSLVGGILAGLLDPTGSSDTAMVVLIVVYAITILLTLLIGAITAVVQAALVAVITIDLRMRKEGLDLDLQRHVELRDAGRPVGDPYAPPPGAPAPAVAPTRPPGATV
ncbi:hypothetical protein GE115_12065 [Agromyces sp. CFH 90414]|uniref:Glycerophosphoryl diester phosphodiesterase membrane domain-containing protein n=1 Tax=Agromyces agglutinans TaxID=2662258 RepID=A0A6I2FDL1_9MICO|nr:glycerophosphoryl diester phosphodiesterase membrane domain-containing protein [Agromyces agglutinans]MRG60596.1 hypothetical protein [Agromyces agglutinans]